MSEHVDDIIQETHFFSMSIGHQQCCSVRLRDEEAQKEVPEVAQPRQKTPPDIRKRSML